MGISEGAPRLGLVVPKGAAKRAVGERGARIAHNFAPNIRGGSTVASGGKWRWVAEFFYPFFLPQNAGGIGLLNEVSVHCTRQKVAFLKRTPLCHTRNKKSRRKIKKKKQRGQ